jgi:hypothetical protein
MIYCTRDDIGGFKYIELKDLKNMGRSICHYGISWGRDVAFLT